MVNPRALLILRVAFLCVVFAATGFGAGYDMAHTQRTAVPNRWEGADSNGAYWVVWTATGDTLTGALEEDGGCLGGPVSYPLTGVTGGTSITLHVDYGYSGAYNYPLVGTVSVTRLALPHLPLLPAPRLGTYSLHEQHFSVQVEAPTISDVVACGSPAQRRT
jgi:hypothetical protein